MLKRKKKRSQRDWDYEIKKLDEETQLKDSWRYIPIGLDTWKLDYRHNYDPTDDLIESIDRNNAEVPLLHTETYFTLKYHLKHSQIFQQCCL